MDELRSRIVAMTKAGVFGPPGSWPYVRDNNGEHRLGLQFASEIEFFRVGLHRCGIPQAGESDFKEIRIAVKTQLKGEKERAFTSTDSLFFNEVYMYKTLLQLIEADESPMFPKCYYAEACSGNNPARDIVITEDVKPLGFREVGGATLDLDHLKIALRNLGKFHGLSYTAKRKCASFFSKVKDLKPIMFDEDFDSLLSTTVHRGIRPLMESKEYTDALTKLSSQLKEGRAALKMLKTPEEPFAVICHGEFHKSNILFSYDLKGDVREAVFLDLQMSLYSDPSTDISFLLYMNTTQQSRDSYWDELLKEYWKGVIGVEPDPGFTFEMFLSNFERKSIYGYLPTSIFLPIVIDELEANLSVEDFLSHSLPDRIQLLEEFGGEEATEALTKIVKDLLQRGYIEKFLDFNSPIMTDGA